MSPTSTVLRSRLSCFTHSSIRLLTAGGTAAQMTSGYEALGGTVDNYNTKRVGSRNDRCSRMRGPTFAIMYIVLVLVTAFNRPPLNDSRWMVFAVPPLAVHSRPTLQWKLHLSGSDQP